MSVIHIEDHKDKDSQFLSQLYELKEQLELELLSLLRHLTMIDATVLSLLSVFHDERGLYNCTHGLMVGGSVLLFLSLLCGLYCMWQGHRQRRRSLERLAQAYVDQEFDFAGGERAPMLYGFAARSCPILLASGLLLLLVALWL